MHVDLHINASTQIHSTMSNPFILSENDLFLLLKFEGSPSLEQLAQHLGKDPTVISRQLKRISEKSDALIKISGRWSLTEVGRQLNNLSRDFLASQNSILQKKRHLRIGTNREFANKIIAPAAKQLTSKLNVHFLTIKAYERGIEEALLNGEIDLGFDCGKPQNPDIQYSQVIYEIISAVASPNFFKQQNITEDNIDDLLATPHINCDRLDVTTIFGNEYVANNIKYFTNDLAAARALCLASEGWAILPHYAIKEELQKAKLIAIKKLTIKTEKYGVWKLRQRKLQDEFNYLKSWLEQVEF